MRREPQSQSPAVPSSRSVLRNREFRALWLAQLTSVLGDQVTRIVLASLVLGRTGSVALSALSVGLTFLPGLLGGPLLGVLADRCPRRTVMVTCDCLRGSLLALMAVGAIPVPLLLALATLSSLVAAPFEAARGATVPDVLSAEEYPVGQSLSMVSLQSAQLAGFAVGGLMLTLHPGSTALLLDALTFLLSAVLLRRRLRWRPGVPRDDGSAARTWMAETTAGAVLVARSPDLRYLLGLACLTASMAVVPEGLAVAQSAALHGGGILAGTLSAVLPFGTVVGVLLLGRVSGPERRLALMVPFTALVGTALLLCALRPGLPGTVALWALAGVGAAATLPANVAFVTRLDPGLRGRALSVAQVLLQGSQGLAVVLGGLLAGRLGPPLALAVVGAAGLVLLALFALVRPRVVAARRRRPVPLALPVYVLAAGVLTLAGALWLLVGQHATPVAGPLSLPWELLLPLIVGAQAGLVHFQVRQQAHSVSLCHLPVLLGLVCCSPAGFVVGRVAGGVMAMGLVRRQRGVKLCLNTACYTLEAVVAVTVLEASHRLPLPASLYGSLLAADLAGFAVVATAIALYERRAALLERVQPLTWLVPINLLATSVALIAIAALWQGLGYLPLLAAVTLALLLSYRTHSRLRDEHHDLARLHELTAALPPLTPDSAELPAVVEQVRVLLTAEQAELHLPGHPVVRAMAPGRTVTGDSTGAAEALPTPMPAPRRSWRRPAWSRLVSTGTYSGGARRASLVVVDRVGAVRRFDRDDERLLSAVTALLAGALDRGLDRQEALDRACRDPLTGVWSLTEGARLVELSLSRGTGLDALIVDVVGLQDVNSSLGHDAGDALLQRVAERLEAASGPDAVVARLGGDEFLTALPPGSPGPQQILAELTGAAEVHGTRLDLRVRAGFCRYEPDLTVQQLLRQAQAALANASTTGTRYRAWSRELQVDPTRRLLLAADLPEAIRSGAVTVVFQPLCHAESLRVLGAEALARWTHPVLGPVPPGEFVAVAEQTGLIHELTDAVLDQALAQARQWRTQGNVLRVSVNVSPHSLADDSLPPAVFAALARHDLPPEALLLEVTETSLMSDLDTAGTVLQQLRAAGVETALDDFGTGHSSLASLRTVPVGEVKLDRSFLQAITTDGVAQKVVATAVALCHDLGKTVVAEGVEDGATAELLRSLGVDVLQGYHLGRPAPASAWPAHLLGARQLPQGQPPAQRRPQEDTARWA